MSKRNSPSPKEISIEQWLAALEQSPGQEGGFTTREICEGTGVSIERVRNMLRKLVKDGKVECVRAFRLGIDNQLHHVPTYLLKSKKSHKGRSA